MILLMPKPGTRSQLTSIISLLTMGLIVGGGLYAGFQWWSGRNTMTAGVSVDPQIRNRISWGDRSLLPDNSLRRLSGIAAMERKDYLMAISSFETSLSQQPNDPETRIYLNNAKALMKESVKLAVTVPIETDLNLSKEVLRGVSQAQQEINQAGGINGRGMVVVIADDRDNPDTAQQIATTLVQQSDILGVVGHIASSVTLATVPIYDQGQLPIISPVSSAVQLSNKSRYFFRTLPSDYIAARSLANHCLNQLNRKKVVAYFNSQSAYSQSLKNEFSRAIALGGGQLIAEVDLSDANFSAGQSLNTALTQGADAILLATNTTTLDKGLQVVQVNNSRLPILAGDDVYAMKTLEVSQEKGSTMVIAVPWHSLGDPTSEFPKRARSLWGGDVSWRSVTAYDAVQAFSTALQINPTREGIQKSLSSDTFSASGVAGPVSFLPSGDRNTTVQLVTIAKGERSRFGYDFVPLRSGTTVNQ